MVDIVKMTCVEKLSHPGASYRLNGIVECLDKKAASPEEIVLLKRLKTDDTVLAGRTIAAYAAALLDVLGAEPYNGSDNAVQDLIKAWK